MGKGPDNGGSREGSPWKKRGGRRKDGDKARGGRPGSVWGRPPSASGKEAAAERKNTPGRGRPGTEQPAKQPRGQETQSKRTKLERSKVADLLAAVDEIEIQIEKLVAGGEGLGRYKKVPIFVPRSAPGDRLRVRVTERKRDYGRAEIVEILEAGPDRREPPCPYFERCGGCDLQHIEDETQLRHKVAAARETLMRLAGLDEPPANIRVITGPSWGYRLRTQLQVGETIRGPAVGYFARRSHDLVAVERCPVLVEDLATPLAHLPRFLEGVERERLALVAGDDGQWSVSPPMPKQPQGEVDTRVGDFVYSYDAACFFQGHRQLLPQLVDAVLGQEKAGEGTGQYSGELALDLYAGVGLFSLPLARRYKRVIAVEGERLAARFAKLNARRNKLSNVEVEAVGIDGWLSRQGEPEDRGKDAAGGSALAPLKAPAGLRPDRVIVDPPRSGLTPLLRQWLRESKPPRLTYVSCHAAALARDLRLLKQVYSIESLTLIDLFPQTGHLELVVQMKT